MVDPPWSEVENENDQVDCYDQVSTAQTVLLKYTSRAYHYSATIIVGFTFAFMGFPCL